MQEDSPIHMHIMTAEIERDEELEQNRVLGVRDTKIAQQARSGTSLNELQVSIRVARAECHEKDSPVSDHV